MKVAIITTLNFNIGDDFVREGIIYLLRQYYKNETLTFSFIHKHSPVTVRYGFENVRGITRSRLLDKALPLSITRDRILECDLLVQSGAPAYWCFADENNHCATNEWYDLLIKRRHEKIKDHAPLINLAVGTCQPYNSEGEEFFTQACKIDADYIRDFYQRAAATTVRGKVAGKVLAGLDCPAPVLPCTSIFGVKNLEIEPQEGEYVALNYMRGGAHFVMGQKIEFEKWQEAFRTFYQTMKEKGERLVFVCHNAPERDEALKFDPEAEVFFSENYQDYMRFYAKAKYGIMNRVHGAFMLGSLGKPSFLVGNDTRARIIEEIGQRSYFVNDVDASMLLNAAAELEESRHTYPEKINTIRDEAFKKYQEVLSVLPRK